MPDFKEGIADLIRKAVEAYTGYQESNRFLDSICEDYAQKIKEYFDEWNDPR